MVKEKECVLTVNLDKGIENIRDYALFIGILWYIEIYFPSKKSKLCYDRAIAEFRKTLELDPACSTVLPYILEVDC